MNQIKKYFFIASLCLLIFSTSCSSFSLNIDKQPLDKAKEAICDFDIPLGYQTQFVVSIGDMPIISLIGKNENSHIYLVGLPENADIDLSNTSQPVGVLVGRDDDSQKKVWVVDKKNVMIRGQETLLVISEGVSGEGQSYMEMTAIFNGNSGSALVNISSPTSVWDQSIADTFLASLK
jgi:hypothetical protein